ncbi:MAG TPA: MarR family transcriptional regulator [Acidimicrobiales bacterium]|jgi:MarR family transcriptional regulator for hemolysin|nr:MarR family transcriptional regulator [Acidimicrobiales bacterium]
MYRAAPDDPLTKRLTFLGRAIRDQFSARLAEYGCTISTWAVLSHVHANEGLSQAQIAALIGIEGPTLARHLDRLCAEGLVSRCRDDHDRRIVRVHLTPRGEQRWEQLKDVRTRFDDHLTRDLTDEQKAALDAAIDAMHRALEDAHEPAHADD